jgi:drug/metabolite transporter (DMT)-like permease
MRVKRSDLLLLIFNQFVWGAGWTALVQARKQMGPVTLNLWSLGISIVTLIPFVLAEGRRLPPPNPARLTWKYCFDYFMAGVTGLAGMTLLYAWGAGRSLAANGALISMAVPVLTVIVAVVVLSEKVTSARIAGLVFAVVGVLIISDFRGQQISLLGSSLFGNCLLLLGTLANALYVVYSKKLLPVSSEVAVLFWGQVLGFMTSLPFMAFERSSLQPISSYTALTWLSLIFLGGVYYTATMMIFFRILNRLDAGQIMVSNYLQPVFGVLTAALILSEHITWNMIGGGLLVVSGTGIATFEEYLQTRKPGKPDV